MRRSILLFAVFLIGAVLVRNLFTADIGVLRRDLEIQNKVDVSVLDWSRREDGEVVAKLLVENRNEIAVRDIKMTCYADDLENRKIGEVSRLIGAEVGPRARREIDGFGLGPLGAETRRISCMVTLLSS